MTQTQKMIKYFAIALAVFLIISIFSMLFGLVTDIFGLTITKDASNNQVETINDNIDYLDIELGFSKLTFKVYDEFKVETNNEQVSVKIINNKISIREKTKLFSTKNNEVIVYIPNNKIFQDVVIEAGSGNIEIERLNTNVLELDLGAGAININNLNVSGEADIDSGAGKLTIDNSYINNLDLDMGVGEVNLGGIIAGSNDIDAGMGALNINLDNSISNYNFEINKGMGEIRINNNIIKNNYYETTGIHSVKIDGGIGSINVNTLN